MTRTPGRKARTRSRACAKSCLLLTPRLQCVESDWRFTYCSNVDELVPQIARRDREGWFPNGQPRFRVAPMGLRDARDFGEALRVGGDASADLQISRQARPPVSCARGWRRQSTRRRA